MKPLIVITGPTAVGKTDLSIKFAKLVNGEIISADSIQVYKYMNVGSAKITKKEMQGIKHYLIDEFEPDEEFNVTIFKNKTLEYMNEIYEKGKIPIIVGGTGFYIQSVLYDIQFQEEEIDYQYRERLEDIAKEKGNKYLHNMLKQVDEESAEHIHENNVKRVIRALEYYKNTGEKISDHNKKQAENNSPFNFVYFVLNDKRDILYERIDKRVETMFKNGLVKEVRNLMDMGYTKELVSMNGIGYKEVVDYLNHQYSLEKTKEIIKRETRHFAKRQLTWFRREKNVTMINYYDYGTKEEVLKHMIKILADKEIIKNDKTDL